MVNSFVSNLLFQGLYAVLVTPFQNGRELDEQSLENLVEFYLQKKVSGIVTLSVLGEEAELTLTERLHVAEIVLKKVNNIVPVIVGVSGEISSAVEFSTQVSALGTSGFLVLSPAFSTPEQVKQYYQVIGKTTQKPLVILDYPPLTGKLSVDFIKSLVEEVEQVQAIKLEDEPTPQKIRELRVVVGDRLHILGGMGGLYSLLELQAGSEGLMTGFAYPEHLVNIINYFQKGELATASKEYERWLPLLKLEHQGGLALRKLILQRRGVISSAQTRVPTAVIHEGMLKELQLLTT
jgi:4-hydroxy-tetrahydrodipicolinate synthase